MHQVGRPAPPIPAGSDRDVQIPVGLAVSTSRVGLLDDDRRDPEVLVPVGDERNGLAGIVCASTSAWPSFYVQVPLSSQFAWSHSNEMINPRTTEPEMAA